MSSIIGGPVTPIAEIKRKKTVEEIDALMNGQLPDGYRMICLFVPSRAFRILVDAEERTFLLQQLDHGHGYKWRNVQQHKGDFKWEAWSHSWNAGDKAQKHFLLELRKMKVEHNRMVRNAQLHGVLK